MKKIALLFIITSVFAACDPPQSYHEGEWYIKNYTDQTLTISFPPYHSWKNRDVAPGDSIIVWRFNFAYIGKVIPYFERLPQGMASYGEDVSLDILSEHGDLLKRWRYLDKDLPGKQFFIESLWHYYEFHNNGFDAAQITAVWVFEIMPEDLEEESE